MSNDILHEKDTSSETLNRMKTAESVFLPISRETFEKLYLSPKHPSVAGELRKKLGNPTPICLMGFLLASTPNACILMGWRGAGGNGGAILPVYIFFGGFVQVLGAIGEWIIGNTFSSALFFTYGTFWIVQGTTLMPFFGTGTHYSPTGNSFEGQQTASYAASTAFYFLSLALLTTIYLLCSIRTNICLFTALFLLVITFSLIAGSYFQLANGAEELAHRLLTVAGAFNFALCVPIWHIFLVQILEAVDFPVSLPVGDLSGVVLGRSQKVRNTRGRVGDE
ncbi:GPR1/FUN34/yaaH family-domain-containing protein [Aspergillus karnatakaensis]|uniref:putative plasma membrane ammonium transporter (Ato3) n=1 Tax=Aspergillus karnatakaensis TaxID=1810916 RepID=UPI003CCE45DE